MTTETTKAKPWTDSDRHFAGAVHDQADANAGTNRDGEPVVRVDLTYARGGHASTTTMILTQAAATALRDALDLCLPAPASADDEFRNVDSYDLLRFAKAYASLGDAVGSQVEDLLAGRHDEVNPNAVELIRDRLGGMNQELDDALESYADESSLVDEDACPRCGERNQDSLVWQDDATIHCTNCGTRYDPDARQDASQPQ